MAKVAILLETINAKIWRKITQPFTKLIRLSRLSIGYLVSGKKARNYFRVHLQTTELDYVMILFSDIYYMEGM